MKNRHTIVGDLVEVAIQSDTYGTILITMDAEDISKIPNKIGVVTYYSDKNIVFGTYIKHPDGNRTRELLHRHLMELPNTDCSVLFANGDMFDFRKSNLVIGDSLKNAVKPRPGNKSGILGIRYNPRVKNRPWNAIFNRGGVRVLDRHFPTKEEAVAELNRVRKEHGVPPVEVN